MMKVILSEPDEGYSRIASSALHLIYYICFFYFKETRTVFMITTTTAPFCNEEYTPTVDSFLKNPLYEQDRRQRNVLNYETSI
jgi:hypothetical protein